jgi:hypothetical protein
MNVALFLQTAWGDIAPILRLKADQSLALPHMKNAVATVL